MATAAVLRACRARLPDPQQLPRQDYCGACGRSAPAPCGRRHPGPADTRRVQGELANPVLPGPLDDAVAGCARPCDHSVECCSGATAGPALRARRVECDGETACEVAAGCRWTAGAVRPDPN